MSDPEQPKPRDPAKRPQPEPPGIGRPMRRDDKEQPDERSPERPVRREEQQPETD